MKRTLVGVALCAAFLLVSCQEEIESEIATLKEQATARDQKIQTLEKQVEVLQYKVKSKEQKAAEKKAAQGLLAAGRADAASGQIEDARENLNHLIKTYPMAVETIAAQQTLREINIIGQDAGAIDAGKWFSGNSKMHAGKITVFLFWRPFDPYSQDELTKLQGRYQKYQSKGLNLIGVTGASRLYPDERVTSFISELKLTFPIAQDREGAMTKRFVVNTLPAAAMVKNGKIVWRGHPSRLKDEFIEKWLEPDTQPYPFPK